MAPALSVILVIGPQRPRSQRALDALCAQDAIDITEIIVVDMAPESTAPLEVRADRPVTYLWGAVDARVATLRFTALQHVRAPIVAYLEDHVVARPGWAAAVIDAHKGPWSAVGYAFENANPDSYLSRASLVNDYGPWIAPVRHGETQHLPGHNLSFKMSVLRALGDRLESLMAPDFALREALRTRGDRFFIAADAVVAHENFTTMGSVFRAHFDYMRMLAATRARLQHWSQGRRLFYAAAVLGAAPPITLWRLYGGLRGRAPLVPLFLASAPFCVVMRLASAVGESLGYVAGEGGTAAAVDYWETVAVRAGQ